MVRQYKVVVREIIVSLQKTASFLAELYHVLTNFMQEIASRASLLLRAFNYYKIYRITCQQRYSRIVFDTDIRNKKL